MNLRPWAALVMGAFGLAGMAPANAQQSHAATIASFKYAPPDVRISVGESVEWTNLDATVHTVTASRGEFSSTSMRQGQTFTAQFNVPGVYPYFCEPHEFMTGTVSVTGPAPATTAPATTTTTPGTTTAAPSVTAPPTTTTSAIASATTTTAAAGIAPFTPPPANLAAVTSGAVGGGTPRTAPLAATGVVVLLAAIGLAVLLRIGKSRVDALRFTAAACTLVTALVHLQLRFALDYPEPIGTLLVIEAAGATVLAAWLFAQPWTRTTQLVAVAGHIAALGALAITRTGIGLFGFHELGWDPSPQLPVALTVGVIAIGLLGAAPVDDRIDSVVG